MCGILLQQPEETNTERKTFLTKFPPPDHNTILNSKEGGMTESINNIHWEPPYVAALCQLLLKEIHQLSSYPRKLVCIHPSTREGRLAPRVAFLPPELFPSCWLFVISWVCELGINCLLGEVRLGSLKLSCPLVIAPKCTTDICKLPGVNAVLLTPLWILRPSFHFNQQHLVRNYASSGEWTKTSVRFSSRTLTFSSINRHQTTCKNTATITNDFSKDKYPQQICEGEKAIASKLQIDQ